MKLKIKIDKKTIMFAGVIGAVIVVFFLLVGPLWSKASRVSREAGTLNNELSGVRQALKEGKSLNGRHPLSRGEVSVAINEIMEVGASLNIKFSSTSPQRIQKYEESKYPVLPIRMQIRSKYEDLGKYLKALENLTKSIVTVREFAIERKQEILPDVLTGLMIDIHLKEGEGGQK